MRKFINLCLLCLILGIFLSSAVFAEKILRVELVVTKDNTVFLKSIKGMYGNSDAENTLKQNYEIKITGNSEFSSFIPVQFVLYTDPPSPAEDVLLTKRLPYFGNEGQIQFLFENEVLFEYDLKNLCNNNNVCDGFENYITCESDCMLSNFDGVCVSDRDNICDPDCSSRVDSDCIVEEVKEEVLSRQFTTLIILVILLLASLFVFHKFFGQEYSKRFKRKRR